MNIKKLAGSAAIIIAISSLTWLSTTKSNKAEKACYDLCTPLVNNFNTNSIFNEYVNWKPTFSVGSKTAVYDIKAHTVYLPDGTQLEAHSGRNEKMDNPRFVKVKNQGPTPPTTYALSYRESLFHGVTALRLTPKNKEDVFNRDGFLAHPYFLGKRGDSKGCVSFKNYNVFLNAYRRGQITDLVVVSSRD